MHYAQFCKYHFQVPLKGQILQMVGMQAALDEMVPDKLL